MFGYQRDSEERNNEEKNKIEEKLSENFIWFG
jgi:hypothetical protein